MKKQYTIKYKTMMDYWRSIPFKKIVVMADNDLEAESLFIDSIFPLFGFDPELLVGQIYTFELIENRKASSRNLMVV